MQVTPDLVSRAIEGLGAPREDKSDLIRPDTKNAAVIVGIRLSPEPIVVAVLRSSTLRDHAGEVGFPGGKHDPTDSDLRWTALRELGEELGITVEQVDLLGRLTPVPVITGRYLIHPYVAHLRDGALPSICSGEIARILEIPMMPWLSGERPIRVVEGTWRGQKWMAPYFELEGCTLYGASAVIFYELLARVARALGRELPAVVVQGGLPWGDRYSECRED